MPRLEFISYLFATLFLAWGAGWFFTNGYPAALILCCAIWAGHTLWMVLRALRLALTVRSLSSGPMKARGN
ncbi:MAG TPA: hypothetical protein VIB38_10025 [Aestuariivirgaceae bacterium]|jgi:hypothetical protein